VQVHFPPGSLVYAESQVENGNRPAPYSVYWSSRLDPAGVRAGDRDVMEKCLLLTVNWTTESKSVLVGSFQKNGASLPLIDLPGSLPSKRASFGFGESPPNHSLCRSAILTSRHFRVASVVKESNDRHP
jgi:hypothetical protein